MCDMRTPVAVLACTCVPRSGKTRVAWSCAEPARTLQVCVSLDRFRVFFGGQSQGFVLCSCGSLKASSAASTMAKTHGSRVSAFTSQK